MTSSDPAPGLCAVVLAAGMGTRLRPLTDHLPKALCPVGNVPLLDLALASVAPYADDVAVNVHYLPAMVRAHCADRRVHLSDETGRLLGSGGALGHLRSWIAGRPVLVRNVDAYLTGDLSVLVSGWDGVRPRILGIDRGTASDFGNWRYVGACLIPAVAAAALPDDVASLFEHVWQPAWLRGDLEIVPAQGVVVDCGTPHDYLAANLIASGGRSVVGPGADVRGRLERAVVWPGGHVGAGEVLVDCIRVGRDVTVDARA